jgi:transcriptional regulator with XRE-family HTH domain
VKTPQDRVEDLFRLVEGRKLIASGRARELRAQTGLSVIDFARACGCSAASITRWENGNRIPRGESGHRYTELVVALEERMNGEG